MAINQYDAIVVGARCAGSPTAMLLARKGYEVLVVDRARFPSDTVSTHLLHPPGVAALARWGLLEPLVATGCPPIDTYAFDVGPFTLSGAPGTAQAPVAYAPRRTVLDKLLVDAAAQAGAEIREGFTVESVVVDDRGVVTGIRGHGGDGRTVTEHAKVVVGADGRHSLVARAVQPEHYQQRPRLQVSYYSYWSDLPMAGRFETYLRPDRGFAAWPTHDELTLQVLPMGDGRLRPSHRRGDLPRRVLLRGERQADHVAGRGGGTRLSEPDTARPSQEEDDMSEANKALARSFFQEADRGRTPVELCTPGFTAHFPGPPPMDLEGFDQFEAMFRSAFSNQEHAIEDLVGEGDEVAVRLRFEGVQTGDFMGVPASGKHFSVEGTAFLRIADGKVAQLWGLLDQMALLQQIGGPPTA